jgi:hypothetical protein
MSEENEDIIQETMFENLDTFMKEFKDKLMFMGDKIGLKLNTPNAMICDTCKRDLAYKALMEGHFKKQPNIFAYLYATDSKRIPPIEEPSPAIEEKIEENEEPAIIVIRHGSWYELPNGTRVRKKDLPKNVIIKEENDDEI